MMDYDFSVHTPVNTRNKPDIIERDKPGIERTVLYGTDLRKTKVPADTMSGAYQVAFRAKNGDSFGMDDKLLSKHLLLLGGIGCGKTNVFNFLIESLQKRMTDNDVMF